MVKRITRVVSMEMVTVDVVFEGQKTVDEMLLAIPAFLTPNKRSKAIAYQLEEAHAAYIRETSSFIRVMHLSMPLEVFVQMADVDKTEDHKEGDAIIETDTNS